MAFLITEQLWKPIREKKIKKNWKYGMSRRVGQGLVVKAEDSRQGGPGFKPHLWRQFFRQPSFGSKLGTKFVENSNLALLLML
jgi:hypothetical protein